MTHPQDEKRAALPYTAENSPAFAESDRAFLDAIRLLSSDLLFHLDLKTDRVELFGQMREVYQMPRVLEQFPQGAFDIIAQEDHAVILQAVQDMKAGKQDICDIRLKGIDGSLCWHRHEYVLRYDAAGIPIEALGKITNVHAQRMLEDKIARDGLTKCMRKESFELACRNDMEEVPGKQHALFIVDIDNFKAINDNLGHRFGDMVLREVGARLRDLFRNSDYIGRVGGDEFMVFMRDVEDLALVSQKAKAIVEAMDVTYSGQTHSYRITGSVGIAVSPYDTGDFAQLYQNADIALYDVKNRGKNGYARYHTALSKGTMENTTPFDVAARSVAQHFNPALLANVFDLLFESKEFDLSMQQVLQLLGRQFGVSRTYVFEQSKEVPGTYTNTYEWCASGINPEIENLQNLPGEVLEAFFDKANEQGVFYSNDLNALNDDEAYTLMHEQGIQSFLHAYIYTGTQVSYMLGFDECTGPRVWTPMEVSTIMYVNRVVAQFLNYKHALNTANIISQERLAVLDSLNYFSYIIDAENHRIRYFNKATKAVIPGLKIDDVCYRVLRGQEEECHNCPLKTMRAQGCQTTRSIIYTEPLDTDMLVHAVRLPQFDGKECVFVSSSDVTDLVHPDKPHELLPRKGKEQG